MRSIIIRSITTRIISLLLIIAIFTATTPEWASAHNAYLREWMSQNYHIQTYHIQTPQTHHIPWIPEAYRDH